MKSRNLLRKKFYNIGHRGLYFKTIQIRNCKFHNKLVCFSKPGYFVTTNIKDTSLLRNLSICHKLRIRNLLKVQAPDFLTRRQSYKTFYCRYLRIFVISQSVCPWQAFQAYLMFMGKERSLPQSRAPKMCFTHVGCGLTSNISLGWKGLPRTNTLAYCENT